MGRNPGNGDIIGSCEQLPIITQQLLNHAADLDVQKQADRQLLPTKIGNKIPILQPQLGLWLLNRPGDDPLSR